MSKVELEYVNTIESLGDYIVKSHLYVSHVNRLQLQLTYNDHDINIVLSPVVPLTYNFYSIQDLPTFVFSVMQGEKLDPQLIDYLKRDLLTNKCFEDINETYEPEVEFEVVSSITTVSFEFTRNNGTLVQGTIDVSEDDINFDSEIPLTKKEEELLQEKVFDYLSSSYD